MNRDRIKRKVVKAGVQLSVQDEASGSYVARGYFPNKLEAQQTAAKLYPGKNFRTTGVRIDATPLRATAARGEAE